MASHCNSLPTGRYPSANSLFPVGNFINLPGPPPDFIAETGLSHLVASVLWHGIEPSTRKSYASGTKSWQFFCAARAVDAYPAQLPDLMEWVAQRTYGVSSPHMGRVASKTLRSYLSAIRSAHVDRVLPVHVFENLSLRRMLDGATSLNPSIKGVAPKLPILRSTLEKIASSSTSIPGVNVDAAFCLAFAGCLRMGEITYSDKQRSEASFTATKATRSDVHFSSSGDHLTFRLKRSKADREKQGIQIVVAATYDAVCPVAALQRLFSLDPQAPSAPLFTAPGGAAFSSAYAKKTLKSRLTQYGIPNSQLTGHSFRRGTAQHALDSGFADEEIQRLGRWSSEAFRLYCSTSQHDAFRLSQRFQLGVPTPFSPPLARRPQAQPRAQG